MRKFTRLCIILTLVALAVSSHAQLLTFNINPSSGFCLNATNSNATVMVTPSPAATAASSYSWATLSPTCHGTVLPVAQNGSIAVLAFVPETHCCGIYIIMCSAYDTNQNLIVSASRGYTLYCSPNINVATTFTNTTLCRGETATLSASGAQTYSWSGPAVSNFTTASVSVSPIVTGCYSVTGSNTLGCTSYAVKCFTVSNCLNTSKIKEDEWALSLYPIPTADFLYVESAQLEGQFFSFHIYGAFGQLLREGSLFISENQPALKTEDLPEGLYTLLLENKENEIFSKRFVIER